MPEEILETIPLSQITPESGDHLVFDGYWLNLVNTLGGVKRGWKAKSGKFGTEDFSLEAQSAKDKGPIPGDKYGNKYIVDPGEIDRYHKFDPWDVSRWGGDERARYGWGDTRILLVPTLMTKTLQVLNKIDRDRMYIHGGGEYGSIGCIDLAENAEDFFSILEKYDTKLFLYVDY